MVEPLLQITDALWYGLAAVRALAIVVVLSAACGGGRQIQNLPLSWRGVDEAPRPSGSVAQSFATSPFSFGLRDVRPDPSAVGTYEDSGFVVRTTDNVAQYCSTRLGEMLVHAGARLNEPPMAALEMDLLDYHVVEGGRFNGTVRIRAFVRRGGNVVWSRTYVGNSSRWGRTHNPENFNEALSNALAEVTKQLVQDEEFALALVGADPSQQQPYAPPHSMSSRG